MNYYKKSNLLNVTRMNTIRHETRNPRAMIKPAYDHIASIDITQFYQD
jgi:hypothetical protein